MIHYVNGNAYYCIRRCLSQNDTIEGILKGQSYLSLQEALEIFYLLNGRKNFRTGETVIIPVTKKEDTYDEQWYST